MSAPWLSEGHPPPTRRSMGGGMGGGARAPCFRQGSTGGCLHDLPAPPWPVDQPLGASWAWRPRVVGTERFSPTRPLSCGENAFPQLDEASCGYENATWVKLGEDKVQRKDNDVCTMVHTRTCDVGLSLFSTSSRTTSSNLRHRPPAHSPQRVPPA